MRRGATHGRGAVASAAMHAAATGVAHRAELQTALADLLLLAVEDQGLHLIGGGMAGGVDPGGRSGAGERVDGDHEERKAAAEAMEAAATLYAAALEEAPRSPRARIGAARLAMRQAEEEAARGLVANSASQLCAALSHLHVVSQAKGVGEGEEAKADPCATPYDVRRLLLEALAFGLCLPRRLHPNLLARVPPALLVAVATTRGALPVRAAEVEAARPNTATIFADRSGLLPSPPPPLPRRLPLACHRAASALVGAFPADRDAWRILARESDRHGALVDPSSGGNGQHGTPAPEPEARETRRRKRRKSEAKARARRRRRTTTTTRGRRRRRATMIMTSLACLVPCREFRRRTGRVRCSSGSFVAPLQTAQRSSLGRGGCWESTRRVAAKLASRSTRL